MSIEQANPGTTRLSEILTDVFRCWMSEWLRLGRALYSHLLPPDVRLTQITFRSADIVVQEPNAQPNGVIIRDEPGEHSAITALRSLLAGTCRVGITIPEAEILRPSLRLPKASRRVLQKALFFELARVSPVNPEQLYFDFELQPLGKDASEVQTRVRAVRRTTVDAARAKCHAAGAEIAEVRLGADASTADPRCFPLDRKAFLLTQWQRFKLLTVSAATLFLLLVLLLTAYAREVAGASGVATQVEAARPLAAEVSHARLHIGRLAAEQSFLFGQKQKPLLVAQLAALSHALPDDTSLAALQMTGKRIRIQGYSRSASRLVSEITGAGFRNVQFEAPVVREAQGSTERFDISFEARP